MATTDDNDNQGSSAGEAEISVDDIASENRPCNAEDGAHNTVDMTTETQDSSTPLNLTSSRSDNLVPHNKDDSEKVENNDVINRSQSSPNIENKSGVVDEVKGDNELTLTSEHDELTVYDKSANHDNKSSDSSENEVKKLDEISESKEDDADSGMLTEISHQDDNTEVSGEDVDDSQNSECNVNERNSDTKDSEDVDPVTEEEQVKEGKEEDDVSAMDCEESMDSLQELESAKEDSVNRSETSTPKFTAIIKSDESCSQEPLTHRNSEPPVGSSITSDQNSLLSSTDEPPLLISSMTTECFIRLDEETFEEWNEKKRKMGFGSDAEMAKFLLKRLVLDKKDCMFLSVYAHSLISCIMLFYNHTCTNDTAIHYAIEQLQT